MSNNNNEIGIEKIETQSIVEEESSSLSIEEQEELKQRMAIDSDVSFAEDVRLREESQTKDDPLTIKYNEPRINQILTPGHANAARLNDILKEKNWNYLFLVGMISFVLMFVWADQVKDYLQKKAFSFGGAPALEVPMGERLSEASWDMIRWMMPFELNNFTAVQSAFSPFDESWRLGATDNMMINFGGSVIDSPLMASLVTDVVGLAAGQDAAQEFARSMTQEVSLGSIYRKIAFGEGVIMGIPGAKNGSIIVDSYLPYTMVGAGDSYGISVYDVDYDDVRKARSYEGWALLNGWNQFLSKDGFYKASTEGREGSIATIFNIYSSFIMSNVPRDLSSKQGEVELFKAILQLDESDLAGKLLNEGQLDQLLDRLKKLDLEGSSVNDLVFSHPDNGNYVASLMTTQEAVEHKLKNPVSGEQGSIAIIPVSQNQRLSRTGLYGFLKGGEDPRGAMFASDPGTNNFLVTGKFRNHRGEIEPFTVAIFRGDIYNLGIQRVTLFWGGQYGEPAFEKVESGTLGYKEIDPAQIPSFLSGLPVFNYHPDRYIHAISGEMAFRKLGAYRHIAEEILSFRPNPANRKNVYPEAAVKSAIDGLIASIKPDGQFSTAIKHELAPVLNLGRIKALPSYDRMFIARNGDAPDRMVMVFPSLDASQKLNFTMLLVQKEGQKWTAKAVNPSVLGEAKASWRTIGYPEATHEDFVQFTAGMVKPLDTDFETFLAQNAIDVFRTDFEKSAGRKLPNDIDIVAFAKHYMDYRWDNPKDVFQGKRPMSEQQYEREVRLAALEAFL